MSTARSRRWLPVAIAAVAALAVAGIGGTLTDVGPWYQALRKPNWQPPDWAFAPGWTIILALAALSAAAAWRQAPDASRRELVIGLYSANGFLNILWSLLFFRLQRPDWALAEVVLLWLSVLAPMMVVWRWSNVAGYLMVPYLLWVTFAGLLNLAIVRLN